MTQCAPASAILPPIGFEERALEAAGLGGWELDIATNSLRWTAATYAIHGLDQTYVPTVDTAIDFYEPQYRPLVRAALAKALDSGEPWDLELRFRTAKGVRIWVRACGMAVRENKRVVRFVGTFEDITRRREILALTQRLSVVAAQMKNAVVMTDPQGRTEWLNDAFVHLTGFDMTDLKGRCPGHLLQGPDTDPDMVVHMRECLERAIGFEVELVNYSRDGQPYWIAVTCTPIRDAQDNLTGFIAVESDITARKQAEQAVRRESHERRQAEELLRDVLEALPSAVAAYGPDETLILTNRAYREMFPLCAQIATPGRSLEQITRFAVARGQYPQAGTTRAEREAWIMADLAACRTPGPARTLELPDNRFVQARESRGNSGILVCICSDMTLLKRTEAEVRAQAESDYLTGLANRRGFMHRLERTLRDSPATQRLQAARSAGALVLFDVDHFKQINDTFGHDVGDAMLAEVALRLRSTMRDRDVAARLGGDEFVALLPGLTDRATASARIDTLMEALSQPITFNGERLDVAISAGAAFFPLDGTAPDGLLKAADLALYQAKRGGRAGWRFFSSADSMHAPRTLAQTAETVHSL